MLVVATSHHIRIIGGYVLNEHINPVSCRFSIVGIELLSGLHFLIGDGSCAHRSTADLCVLVVQLIGNLSHMNKASQNTYHTTSNAAFSFQGVEVWVPEETSQVFRYSLEL